MTKKFENILETVGNTPVVKIGKLAPPGINLFVKIEAFNPLGSVKDRLALGVIEHAEKTGELSPGQTVIEATSGNTGIGLAMVCAQKGYPLVVTMAESFSIERRKMMRFLGAKVVLTPASEKGSGMVAKAEELAEAHGWFLTRQFENEANADMHSRTTAPEIIAAFDGERLDYWVTGYGTGGTLKGVARVLKEQRPKVKIVVCEPDNSQLIGSGIPQPSEGSHPHFRPHLMQGWTPDFIPKLAADTVAMELIDQVIPVDGNHAMKCSRDLARVEGIFVGTSAGATLSGALTVAEQAPEGSTILCMLPDTGERYLSTPLFEDIPEHMTAEEIKISESTPGYRFGAPPPPAPAKADEEDEEDEEAPATITPKAAEFVAETVGDPEQPVVLFALEWCEFCWSVRKMFAKFDVPFRSVDLDSVAYQENNWGGQIREALQAQTSMQTIPQIFVGGEFMGGCTELFDAWKEGRVQSLLKESQVAYDESVDLDPYSFLPKWLHPR